MTVCVDVRALYALTSGAGAQAPEKGPVADPHRRVLPVSTEAVSHERFAVRRPATAEYASPGPGYRVRGAEVRRWCAPGLPDVGELRVSVEAHGLAGVIGALKDLYDPMVDVEIDGRLLSAHFRDGAPQRLGGRALVVFLGAGCSGVDDAGLAQLFCKDTEIDFDLHRMCVESPDDLNAARANAITVWGEQTIISAMDPALVARGWGDTVVGLSAAVTAARQATEASVDRVREIRSSAQQEPMHRLASMVAVQADHELAVRTRLDTLLITVGRPLASYLESLVRQTRLDVAVSSLEGTLRDALRNIEVEARLEERRRAAEAAHAARDLRTVVSIFAVVSILFSIIGVVIGMTSIPLPSESRFGHLADMVAVAVLAFLCSAAVALVVVRSTSRRSIDDVRVRRRWRAGLAVALVGAAGLLVAAIVVPEGPMSIVLVCAAVGLVVTSATQLARVFRLSSEPE